MENTDLLQREGVKILHTMEDLKVHSKVVLVERRERRGMKRYAYIGTGNFNENTALIYSDFGLFTSHDEITEDVLNVFLFLSNNHKQFTFKHLMVSPYYMRMQFDRSGDKSCKKREKSLYIRQMQFAYRCGNHRKTVRGRPCRGRGEAYRERSLLLAATSRGNE